MKDPQNSPGAVKKLLRAGFKQAGFTKIQSLRQVHRARVVTTGRGKLENMAQPPPEADGLVGREKGVLGLVTVADCVPVFLLDPISLAWGLVHAGWRGVAEHILAESLRVLEESFGISAERLEIYLGPAICGSCYEVGPEVVNRLEKLGAGEKNALSRGKTFLDLRSLLARDAQNRGVPSENIYISSYCTRCHNELFYSYRGQGDSALGCMWAFFGNGPGGMMGAANKAYHPQSA